MWQSCLAPDKIVFSYFVDIARQHIQISFQLCEVIWLSCDKNKTKSPTKLAKAIYSCVTAV